jgi:ribosome recycling factor
MTISELKAKLARSTDHLKDDLSQVRTGRATPVLIENIPVEAYGAKMTVKELGSINVPDAQNLTVSVWDKGLLSAVASAIRESELKVDPVVDGNVVRVPVPTLTEERRREFVKIVSSKVEEAKNSMRNIRQDAMKDIDKEFADKSIGEDEKFSRKEEVEEAVKEYISEAEELGETKKTDLLTV